MCLPSSSLQMAAFTLIYFDLRVRTEGFDIALLTREATGETDALICVAMGAGQAMEEAVFHGALAAA